MQAPLSVLECFVPDPKYTDVPHLLVLLRKAQGQGLHWVRFINVNRKPTITRAIDIE